MELITKLTGKIFKNTETVEVEMHAGGFFIRKKVHYLIFCENHIRSCSRSEGLHPFDNKYEQLFKEACSINSDNSIFKPLNLNNHDKNPNIIILNNEFICTPSIFSENLPDSNITELLFYNQNSHESKVFHLIYDKINLPILP